jgi:hypothetical protein
MVLIKFISSWVGNDIPVYLIYGIAVICNTLLFFCDTNCFVILTQRPIQIGQELILSDELSTQLCIV